MLTIIAFAVTIIGSINWLTIGLLQYDFIAGVFGYQASIFSRIIYIIFGIACSFLVFKLFKGKGTLAVFSRRNKKDLVKNLEKLGKSKEEKELIEQKYAHSNVESAQESALYSHEDYYDFPSRKSYTHPSYEDYPESMRQSAPRSFFDEHFDDNGGRDV